MATRNHYLYTSLFIPKRRVSSRPHRTRFRTVGNSIYLVRAQCQRTIHIYIYINKYALFFLPSLYINILLYICVRSIEYVRGGNVYRATSRVISYTSIYYYYYYIHTTTSFCPTEARPQMPRCHLTIASGQTGSDTRAPGGNIVKSLSFSRRSIGTLVPI